QEREERGERRKKVIIMDACIRHRTHPEHLLKPFYIPNEFLCDGCDQLGSGPTYSCEACNFDLHEICATCPSTIQSGFHPKHPLTLVNKPVANRVCDLCGDFVCGLFYTCRTCAFDVHPLCTQLPVQVKLPMHRHRLTLKPGRIAPCDLCDEVCASWRYTCRTCDVDIHLECALQDDDDDDEIVLPEPPPMMMMMVNIRQPPPMMMVNNGQPPPMMMMGYNQQPRMITPPPAERQKSSSSGSKKIKIYSILGRLAISALTTSVTGIPLSL
ncbi:hypothetical protein MIMGU_mgv1a024781mg, partial [Erythranthe guttata]